jgi:hypothetical protein
MRYAGFTVLAVLLLTNAALSLECTDHGASEALQLGYQSMSRWLTAIDATDDHLCYARLDEASGRPVLYWCDVVAGASPVLLGSCFLTGTQVSVLRIDGTRVAAMFTDGTWRVVDFADSDDPVVVAPEGSAARCRDLDLAGDLVVTAQDSLLVITSLASGGMQEIGRYAPARSSGYSLGVTLHSLDVAWPHCWALVAEDLDTGFHTYDLVVLDLTDATAPVLLDSRLVGTSNYPYATTFGAVRADGARACLWSRSENLDTWIHDPYIVDYRTFTYDFTIGAGIGAGVRLNDSVAPARVVGDWAFVPGSQLTYYHRQGGSWSEVGSWPCTGQAVAASRTGIWAGGVTGFGTFRPVIPDAWPWLGVAHAPGSLQLRTMVAAGDHVLLYSREYGCDHCAPPQGWYAVLDAADPLQLANIGTIATTVEGPGEACAVAGNLAYTAAGIWDWTTRTQVGSFGLQVLAIVGPALWAAGQTGVELYDLDDPLVPSLVGSALAGTAISKVVMSGNRAVLQSDRQLVVADITDPLAPVELSRTTVGNVGEVLYDLAMEGDRLFVSLGTYSRGRLLAYVLDGAGVPAEVGSYQSSRYWGYDLELDGAVLYAAVPYAGVEILDVANAAHPWRIGTCLGGREVRALHLQGDVLYAVSDRVDAVRRQCSTAVPVMVRDFTAAWRAGAVHVNWTMSGDSGVMRVLAAAPGREWVVPWQVEGTQWEAVDNQAPRGTLVRYELQNFVDGRWVTLSRELVDVPATILSLANPQPNPFNPSTRLVFALDEAGFADLAIFDVAGHRLRTLASGWHGSGDSMATWDGCDDAGRRLPAGVYMAQLSTDRGIRKAKLLMLN